MLHYRLITAPPDWSTLTCVKLAFSRTSGTINVVTCVENVLVRTSWKETRLDTNESERIK